MLHGTLSGRMPRKRPLKAGPPASPAVAQAADPIETFEKLIKAYVPRCKTRQDAVRMAVRAAPAAHKAYLAAVNAGRPAAFHA